MGARTAVEGEVSQSSLTNRDEYDEDELDSPQTTSGMDRTHGCPIQPRRSVQSSVARRLDI